MVFYQIHFFFSTDDHHYDSCVLPQSPRTNDLVWVDFCQYLDPRSFFSGKNDKGSLNMLSRLKMVFKTSSGLTIKIIYSFRFSKKPISVTQKLPHKSENGLKTSL